MKAFIDHKNEYYFFAVTTIHAALWVFEDLEKGLHNTLLLKFDSVEVALEIFMDTVSNFWDFWKLLKSKADIMQFNTHVKEFWDERWKYTDKINKKMSEILEKAGKWKLKEN